MNAALPRDPALPQLSDALDMRAMAVLFDAALPGLHVAACRIDRVKYRPRRNCSVSYVLSLRDEASGRDFEQRVAARYFADGDSARRYARVAGRFMQASAAGPSVLHVASLDLLAYWLPNDARLDALSVLHDDTMLRTQVLPDVVAAMTNGLGRLIGHRADLVQYVPEHRACARVELRLQPARGAPAVRRTVFAKADVRQIGAFTHAAMAALRESRAQAAGRLRTPRPILWQPDAGLHWQEAIEGPALLDVAPQVGPAPSAWVGERLAALHATPMPAAHAVTADALRQRTHEVAGMLALVEPDLQPVLDRLVRLLESGAGALASQPPVSLHGDLHPRNILVDGDRLAFIDLDGACRGPAVIELGAWVADSLYRALQCRVAARAAEPSWRAFLAGYAGVAGNGALAEPLLAWSVAHHLLCQRAYRCLANLKPGRYALVPQLLAIAEAVVSAGTVDAAGDVDFPPLRAPVPEAA